MALIDRHFIAEHFNILIAFFWIHGSKDMNFQSLTYFSAILIFSEKRPKLFPPRPEIATEADGWARRHSGRHVGAQAHGRD